MKCNPLAPSPCTCKPQPPLGSRSRPNPVYNKRKATLAGVGGLCVPALRCSAPCVPVVHFERHHNAATVVHIAGPSNCRNPGMVDAGARPEIAETLNPEGDSAVKIPNPLLGLLKKTDVVLNKACLELTRARQRSQSRWPQSQQQ
jgi:hypothetical protein